MSNYSIGLSGLTSNSSAIDTISNNIANASTVGYKAGEFIFQDQFYKAINPLDPARAGQGAARQTIRRLFNMGTVQDSQNTLDMAITGAMGMFRLADGNDPNTTYYTRNGQFAVSKDTDPNFPKRSYIVNQNGMFLTGYTSQDGSTLSDDWTGRITMPPTELEPQTTTLSTVAVNLDARTNTFLPSGSVPFDPNTATSYNNRISQTVYSADDNGGAHTLQLYYRRVDDQDATVTYDGANFSLPASAVAKNPMGASQVNVVLTNDTSEGVRLVSQGNRATVARGSVSGASVINVANSANITQYSRLLVNGIDREATVASVQATGGEIDTARAAGSVAQSESLALSGTFAADDEITVTVSGVALTYTVTANDLTADGAGGGGAVAGNSETAYRNIAANLATQFNASPNSAHAVITATGASGVVSFSADTAGDAFTLTATTDNSGTVTKATTDVAQRATVKLSGTFAAGDILTTTVGGVALAYTVVANDLTADGAGGGGAVAGNSATAYSNIATKIAAAFNASTDTAHTPVTASAGPSQVFLIADTAGDPFTLAVSNTGSGSMGVSTVNVAQADTVTLSGTYSANDVVSITVGGVAVSYTVLANDLTANGDGTGGAVAGNSATAYANIATKLAAAYNASTNAVHTPVTASASGAVVSLTADTAGQAFTASTDVTAAQTDTVTLSGTFAENDTVTITVGGVALTYTVAANDLTADGAGGGGAVLGNSATAYSNIATAVAAAYNASANAAHTPVTASASGAVVTLKEDVAGTAFTVSSAYSNAGGGTGAVADASVTRTADSAQAASIQNQVVVGNQKVLANNTAYTATISGDFAEGDIISLAINGVDLNYTVTALDVANGGGSADLGTIATNLADAFSRSLVPGHQNITATVSGAVITFDADNAAEFSAGAGISGSGAVTLGGTIDITDGDRVEFFNPATTASGVTSTGTGLRTATLGSSNSAIEVGQYVFKVVSGEAVRVVDSAGDPVKVTGISGTTLTLSAVPDVDFANNTLVFYNPVAYNLTMQDGSKVSMSGDLFSGAEQEFTAVTTKYEVYASLDDHFFNSGNNNFYSDIDFPDPVGNGTYNPIAELSFWGGKNIDALVTNPVTGLPTFQSQVTLTGKVTTPGNTPQNTDPDLIFDLDLTGSRNYATPFGVDQSTQDGRSVALLNSVTIDDTGKLVGTYGDGRTYVAGQVVLVNFAATDGLVPSGNNVFTSSYLSGDEVAESVIVGKPGDRGLGGIRAGAVEGSNVDLANELVKLLIQQRMYSANSQSIRAFDDTLTTTIRMAGG
jgi:flagellar hook-basal body protein